MKVYTAGARFFGDQISRIDQGFIALGHELTPHAHEANLIYANDSGAYPQILRDKAAGLIKGKVILTVLDIPEHHLATYDLVALKAQLVQADAVCSISRFVQGQLRHYVGLESHVIYQPIKGVVHAPIESPRARFMHCGRRSDGNKFATVGMHAVQLLGYTQDNLLLVGNEGGWGTYLGVQSDESLNRLYNSVDFVLTLGKVEGISLPTIEAMAAGYIPVVANHLSTRAEFLPPVLFPEYDDVAPNAQSIARFIAQYLEDGTRMADMKERLHQHYLTNWAQHFSPRGVAQAILRVYDSIS